MAMQSVRTWLTTAALLLLASGTLAAAEAEKSRSAIPQDGFGNEQTMSGIVCESEAALDAALEILGELAPDAYHHFNTYEMDQATLARMRPKGCDTATIRGVARVKTTRSVQGETVLVFEIKGNAEYEERSGKVDGTFYSWLGSGR